MVSRELRGIAAEPLGLFALVDYVNFKGEGTLESERYKGEGWGLFQVLEEMREGPALLEFQRAAESVLSRRVKNSPPGRRGESRWLQWIMHATNTGTLLDGTPATGRKVSLPGATFTQYDGDKVVSERVYFDLHDLLKQLKVV